MNLKKLSLCVLLSACATSVVMASTPVEIATNRVNAARGALVAAEAARDDAESAMGRTPHEYARNGRPVFAKDAYNRYVRSNVAVDEAARELAAAEDELATARGLAGAGAGAGGAAGAGALAHGADPRRPGAARLTK